MSSVQTFRHFQGLAPLSVPRAPASLPSPDLRPARTAEGSGRAPCAASPLSATAAISLPPSPRTTQTSALRRPRATAPLPCPLSLPAPACPASGSLAEVGPSGADVDADVSVSHRNGDPASNPRPPPPPRWRTSFSPRGRAWALGRARAPGFCEGVRGTLLVRAKRSRYRGRGAQEDPRRAPCAGVRPCAAPRRGSLDLQEVADLGAYVRTCWPCDTRVSSQAGGWAGPVRTARTIRDSHLASRVS